MSEARLVSRTSLHRQSVVGVRQAWKNKPREIFLSYSELLVQNKGELTPKRNIPNFKEQGLFIACPVKVDSPRFQVTL